MIYFTSDLHFGHANILKSCRPQFSDLSHMDETLIQNWNNTVTNNDTVYICGDLLFRNEKPASAYLSRLRGKKILITGNHDIYWMRNMTEEELGIYFTGIYNMHEMKKNKVLLNFCHYPMLLWESSRDNSLLICGHIHNTKDEYEYGMFRQIMFAFNAGTDINGYRPVRIDELIKNNTLFYNRHYTDEQKAVLDDIIDRINRK